jgi:hypothetical protein
VSYNWSLIVIFVLAVVALGIGFHYFRLYSTQYRLKPTVAAGIYFSQLVAIMLVHAILFWPTRPQQIFSELACLAGASLGWLIGMWLSPVGAQESTKFSRYWTAIGVGSGFTIKWAIDKLVDKAPWFREHAFASILFAIALLTTTAAVYYSRAYDDFLTIAPRVPLAATTAINGDTIAINAGTAAQFYAAVNGPNDPLSIWQVFPSTLGQIDATGLFTAGANTGAGRITAFNLEDPTLSNSIAIQVV